MRQQEAAGSATTAHAVLRCGQLACWPKLQPRTCATYQCARQPGAQLPSKCRSLSVEGDQGTLGIRRQHSHSRWPNNAAWMVCRQPSLHETTTASSHCHLHHNSVLQRRTRCRTFLTAEAGGRYFITASGSAGLLGSSRRDSVSICTAEQPMRDGLHMSPARALTAECHRI